MLTNEQKEKIIRVRKLTLELFPIDKGEKGILNEEKLDLMGVFLLSVGYQIMADIIFSVVNESLGEKKKEEENV